MKTQILENFFDKSRKAFSTKLLKAFQNNSGIKNCNRDKIMRLVVLPCKSIRNHHTKAATAQRNLSTVS